MKSKKYEIQQKQRLANALKKLWKKEAVTQKNIGNRANVHQYEVCRALKKQLGFKNQSFKKLCNYAKKYFQTSLANIPHEIQAAYTEYENLGGKADRVAEVIGILISERSSE